MVELVHAQHAVEQAPRGLGNEHILRVGTNTQQRTAAALAVERRVCGDVLAKHIGQVLHVATQVDEEDHVCRDVALACPGMRGDEKRVRGGRTVADVLLALIDAAELGVDEADLVPVGAVSIAGRQRGGLVDHLAHERLVPCQVLREPRRRLVVVQAAVECELLDLCGCDIALIEASCLRGSHVCN